MDVDKTLIVSQLKMLPIFCRRKYTINTPLKTTTDDFFCDSQKIHNIRIIYYYPELLGGREYAHDG
jgi:hypothetical protein